MAPSKTEPQEVETVATTEWQLKVEKISSAVKLILDALGEDASREGLRKSPERAAKALLFFTMGYNIDPTTILKEAIFQEDHQGLVLVKDIAFSSLCEHHLIPFVGKAHVGYMPNGKIVGLSKIARAVEAFAKRLQVQERLTKQVAQCLFDVLQPRGVAVVIEATHHCMVMRGVEKTEASTTTTRFMGEFETNAAARENFWRALGR